MKRFANRIKITTTDGRTWEASEEEIEMMFGEEMNPEIKYGMKLERIAEKEMEEAGAC